MTYPNSMATSHAVCAAVQQVAAHASWAARICAAAIALRELTGRDPLIVPVRGVAYNRGAVLRLGGALYPTSAGELEYFREQVGRAMLLLGFDAVHAVISFGDHALELSLPRDHAAGVMTEPFAFDVSRSNEAEWRVNAPRFGVTYVYQRIQQPLELPELNVVQLAHDIAERARHLLDQRHLAQSA
jgi:hypothetical protein